MSEFTVQRVDFEQPQQCADLASMLIDYSSDIMGGGTALSREVAEKSVALLGTKPYAYSFLCYKGSTPIGFANCFENVATFAAKTAINIHDVSVIESCRRQGVSRALLAAIEALAISKGCYKLTLEVLEGNLPAQKSYLQFGFDGYELDPEMGKALFWQKVLKG